MSSFRSVHSTAGHWAHAAKECADGLISATGKKTAFNLGFIYVTEDFSEDLSSILTYLRRKTGIGHWAGGVGMGVCSAAGEFFARPALVVMAAMVAEKSFCMVPSVKESINEISSETLNWIIRNQAAFGVVHGDPANGVVAELIRDLAAETESFFAGGLAAAGDARQVADRVTGGGLSGVLFANVTDGARHGYLNVSTGLSQGCRPLIAPPGDACHVISNCRDNIIVGLDGRPALDVFKEDVGDDLADNLERVAGLIHCALPIEGSDTGDYLVRTLIGIDVWRGWLAVGEEVRPGMRIMFVRRDRASAEEDLASMVQKLKKRADGPVKGGLYFSCMSRGSGLFAAEGREVAIIRDAFGPIPLAGFFGNGEIFNDRLYGYTGVLVIFT
jgi:small ligand-binding sensory domain FIST